MYLTGCWCSVVQHIQNHANRIQQTMFYKNNELEGRDNIVTCSDFTTALLLDMSIYAFVLGLVFFFF